MTATLAGIEEPAVSSWLAATLKDSVPPFVFTPLSGGLSNLTFDVGDRSGRHWILRRPPLGELAPTAHDMARECRILSAMAGTPVPVPGVLGLCNDGEVTGAPFFVMEKIDGVVLHDDDAASSLPGPARAHAAFEVVDVLVAIHDVDPDAVGLGDLARRDGYLERQLRRWKTQLDAPATRAPRALHELHARLATRIPHESRRGIVHGDFRLENCVLGRDGRIAAVLDWELCTLGDTLVDLGLLLVYWAEREDRPPSIPRAPTLAGGFPTRAELVARYAATSGREVPDLDFYVAFGFWRMACIVEGIRERHERGATGSGGEDGAWYARRVAELTAMAERAVDALS